MDDDLPTVGRDPLVALLTGYQPHGPSETDDLARIAALMQTTDDPWARAIPLHVTGSALIVHPASGQVLLRWHQRQQAWLQVGGHADPGERDPLAVAMREAVEETGLTDLKPWPTDDLRHAVIVSVPAGKGEPAHEHADLRFVLSTSEPETIVAESENAPLRWLSMSDAMDEVSEDNLRETLTRVQRLLAQ